MLVADACVGDAQGEQGGGGPPLRDGAGQLHQRGEEGEPRVYKILKVRCFHYEPIINTFCVRLGFG